jgi:Butirosin biosynthesis protein H, N-terminal/Domain of unknown function (DUF4872)
LQVNIPGFSHRTGFHCGSSAIKSLLGFLGHDLSEPMCLGLGQGLGFAYISGESASPSHLVFTRSVDLEVLAFKALGIEVQVPRTVDADEGWSWIKSEIDRGVPALIQVNIAGLPYFGTNTNFAGHKVLVVGYDSEAQTATISDNEFPELQTVPLADLARARISTTVPFDLQNDWLRIAVPSSLTSLKEAIPKALLGQAQKMTAEGEMFGVNGLGLLADRIDTWGEAKDWKWCARFTYQIIERRGTGGGAFRLKYAAFLEESVEHCPLIDKLDLPARMNRIAGTWTELATVFKRISDQEQPIGLVEKARPLVLQLAVYEGDFFRDVVEHFSSFES